MLGAGFLAAHIGVAYCDILGSEPYWGHHIGVGLSKAYWIEQHIEKIPLSLWLALKAIFTLFFPHSKKLQREFALTVRPLH